MSGSGDTIPPISIVATVPVHLDTVDELIRAQLIVNNERDTKQHRELPNIVALCLLGIVIGIASNIVSAFVAYVQDFNDTKTAEEQIQEMREAIDKNDYYKERWGSLKHRAVEPGELQTLDCVFNYKDLLVRTRNLIHRPKTLPDLIAQITSGKICLHQLDKECKAAVMGTYSEADRLKYLEGDTKAFSFFKVDTIEEQGKTTKSQYRLKSRKSRGSFLTQSETFSNMGTISDVFDSSELQSRASTHVSQLCDTIPEGIDGMIENEETVEVQSAVPSQPESSRSNETIISNKLTTKL